MSDSARGAQLGRIAGAVLAGALFSLPALADPPCGLCARTVVTNTDLARCFLERYEQFSRRGNGAIAIDLSDCETDRGIVAALPAPIPVREEPDTEFIVSRTHLDCLKRKLEEPGIDLDPTLRIDLEGCE